MNNIEILIKILNERGFGPVKVIDDKLSFFIGGMEATLSVEKVEQFLENGLVIE